MNKKKRKELHRTKQNNKIYIMITLVFTFVYMFWRLFCTIPMNKGIGSVLFWSILLVAELFGLVEMVVHFYNMYDYGGFSLQKKKWKKQEFPHVDVFIPTLDEPCELLEKTLVACKEMEYPDKNKVHIYLCDDGEREEMAVLAKKLHVNYLARIEHSDAKAGNLNYALAHSDAPYIAIFDADMMPKRHFLMETIPCFDKQVGFVQTPQNYYRPDVFQYNLFCEDRIPNEQDYFYRVVQIAKNKSNSVIFGGSNAVLSRKALEEIGGIVTGVVTEDFATGIELQKSGYTGIAIDTVLASGIPPATFEGLIKQRRRWARGCIQSGKKTKFMKSKELTFIQKVNYFTAISYWYTPLKRLIYFMAPVLFALFGVIFVDASLLEVLIFWLPMYLSSNLCMKRFSQNIRTGKWTNIYEMCFFPYLLPSILKEGLGWKQNVFQVTDKSKMDGKSSSLKFMFPFLVGIGISVVSIVRLLEISIQEKTVTYGVILFWLLFNLYYMIIAVYVSWGRNICEEELFQSIKAEGELDYHGEEKQLKNQIKITGLNDYSIRIKNEERLHSLLRQGENKKFYIKWKGKENTFVFPIVLKEDVELSTEKEELIAKIQWSMLTEEEKYKYWKFLYNRDAILPQKLKKTKFFKNLIFVTLYCHLTEEI